MIKSDAERERTRAQLQGFKLALAAAKDEKSSRRSAAIRGSCMGMIHQLDAEIREYDKLKLGKLAAPRTERLDQIAPYIVKIRIAKSVSQTELARRIGVSKQVISRYEESDYQTASLGRLQQILDALGVRTVVTLSA